ncbi:hypothetical protein Lalb_Chr16g0390471 [Lupinus albus]|uniref:Uncharacterized protein n=1 Tax=Lupinus albus TaxID=3870 RepID=A0A6A4P829_LUPAL|nr:hypothetical protein Lalb_Chr16g0390471 [Lupinus albus]
MSTSPLHHHLHHHLLHIFINLLHLLLIMCTFHHITLATSTSHTSYNSLLSLQLMQLEFSQLNCVLIIVVSFRTLSII